MPSRISACSSGPDALVSAAAAIPRARSPPTRSFIRAVSGGATSRTPPATAVTCADIRGGYQVRLTRGPLPYRRGKGHVPHRTGRPAMVSHRAVALLVISLLAVVAGPLLYRIADRARATLVALDGFVLVTV